MKCSERVVPLIDDEIEGLIGASYSVFCDGHYCLPLPTLVSQSKTASQGTNSIYYIRM